MTAENRWVNGDDFEKSVAIVVFFEDDGVLKAGC